MKKLSFLLTSTFSFLLLTSSSLALGDIDTNPTNTTNDCLKLTQNLRLRSNDTTTSNEVTKLQLFLKNNGFLNINPTGYFGSVTKAAVIAYQLSVQLDGTGYVGSYTRGEIAKDTCDNVSDTPNTTTNNSVSSTIPPTFTSNTLGDGTKITRITATIKNGGEGLKYCITTLGSTPCTDLQPVASGGGINWTYTTTDGGTYTIDQDVSSFGYPFVNYQVTLKKKTGETVTSPMVVKNTTNNTNAATTNTNQTTTNSNNTNYSNLTSTLPGDNNPTEDSNSILAYLNIDPVDSRRISIKEIGNLQNVFYKSKACYYLATESPCTYLQPLSSVSSPLYYGFNSLYEEFDTDYVKEGKFNKYNSGGLVLRSDLPLPTSPFNVRIVNPDGKEKTFKVTKLGNILINLPIFDYMLAVGDGTKITRMKITIKNGGEGLRYCITNINSDCNEYNTLASSGLDWKYSPDNGGTYILDQDVSSKNFPFTNYKLKLKKYGAPAQSQSIIAKQGTVETASTYKFAKNVDRFWGPDQFTYPYPPDIDKKRVDYILSKPNWSPQYSAAERISLANKLYNTQQYYRETLNLALKYLDTTNFFEIEEGCSRFEHLYGGTLQQARGYYLDNGYTWPDYNTPRMCPAPFDYIEKGPKKLRVLVPPGVKKYGRFEAGSPGINWYQRQVGVHSTPDATFTKVGADKNITAINYRQMVNEVGNIMQFLDFEFPNAFEGLDSWKEGRGFGWWGMINSPDHISKKASFVYLTFDNDRTIGNGNLVQGQIRFIFKIVDPQALRGWLDACKEEDINKCVEE